MKKKTFLFSNLLFLFLLIALFVPGLEAEAARQLEVGSSIILTDNNMTNGTGFTKSWSSSNTSIAAAYGSGRTCEVLGRAVGTAKITCRTDSWVTTRIWIQTGAYVSQGYWGTRTTHNYTSTWYDVEVKNALEGIRLSESSITLKVGEVKNITVSPIPSDAAIATKTFQSSRPEIATVSTEGQIKGMGVGTATITARANGKQTAVCQVTVMDEKKNPSEKKEQDNQTKGEPESNDKNNTNGSHTSVSTSLVLSKKSLTLPITQTYRLKANIQGKTVTPVYKSTNSRIASVSKSGTVKARMCGTVKIKAVVSKKGSAVCTVKVVPARIKSFKASTKGKNVTFHWKKGRNITGYKIYRSKSYSGKYKAVKVVKASKKSLTLKKQKKGTYYYKIVSYKKIKGKTYQAPGSKAIRVKVK